ncbi:hypothetical protein [Alloactinosynnema sp. L-07]|uniref:hypothetical protein n=1 Tax=Alloactinosynnema sp. L-07 TaxID=1653480 RepID=UPI0006B68338|nr:hypothetical protein [Alloactinosynnema sp. L-07]
MSLSDDAPARPQDPGEAWLLEGLKPSKSDGSPGKLPDAVRALGGTFTEQLAATGQRPQNKWRARALAEQALGKPSPLPASQRDDHRHWIAVRWRHYLMQRCQVQVERERLVALLETNLNGSETAIPDWIGDSVLKILAVADRKRPDVDPSEPPDAVYRRLAEEWHRSEEAAS